VTGTSPVKGYAHQDVVSIACDEQMRVSGQVFLLMLQRLWQLSACATVCKITLERSYQRPPCMGLVTSHPVSSLCHQPSALCSHARPTGADSFLGMHVICVVVHTASPGRSTGSCAWPSAQVFCNMQGLRLVSRMSICGAVFLAASALKGPLHHSKVKDYMETCPLPACSSYKVHVKRKVCYGTVSQDE
jgi:hypothetical protein